MKTFSAIAFLLICSSLNAEERRPNILLIFTDDQAVSCVGAMGNDHIETPNIDRLARRGVLFENAFVTTAICCSNRACILTGQHMARHGIRDFIEPLSAEAFRQTYPALLRKSGYRTGYIGKYAVGNPSRGNRELSLPADKFDAWYGFPQNINFRQEIDGETRFLTTVMTEKAVDFLASSSKEQPFCLTIALKEPHGPFNYFDPQSPDPYVDAELPSSPTFTQQDFESQPEFLRTSLGADSSRKKLKDRSAEQQDLRTVYRTITRADQAVGEVLAALERLELDDNTVVIFTSDHGNLLGDHGLWGKWLMYENSIRIPMIIHDPRLGGDSSGTRRNQAVLSIDLAPTMLALAGLEPPDTMQGEDMMPIVRRDSAPGRDHFYYEHTYQTAPPRSPIPKSEGIRTAEWKYIRYPGTSPVYEQLFDLSADPLERENVAPRLENAVRLQQMRTLCEQEIKLAH